MKRTDVYYKISCLDKKFFSLREAKMYVYLNFTDEQTFLLEGESILKYVNGEPVTETPIIVRNDRYCFCKTVKL